MDSFPEHNLLYLDWWYSYSPFQSYDSVPLGRERERLRGTRWDRERLVLAVGFWEDAGMRRSQGNNGEEDIDIV